MKSFFRRMSRLALASAVAGVVPAAAQDLPAEVQRLQDAVMAVPGISEVQIGKSYLPDIAVTDLNLPGPFADLPIAALRRSDGALPDELLLSIDFSIDRDQTGLKGLEFLAWWVRDTSRGGKNMQLRTIGLPPVAGETVQLGQTLRFTIDWFLVPMSQDMSEVLEELGAAAFSLETSTRLYEKALR